MHVHRILPGLQHTSTFHTSSTQANSGGEIFGKLVLSYYIVLVGAYIGHFCQYFPPTYVIVLYCTSLHNGVICTVLVSYMSSQKGEFTIAQSLDISYSQYIFPGTTLQYKQLNVMYTH